MNESIHHVALAVRDLERSLGFYGAQLGGRLVVRRRLAAGGYFARALGDPGAAATIAVVRFGTTTLELVQWDRPEPPPVGGAHLCLLVSSVAEELAGLDGAGIRPLAPAQRIEEGPNAGGWIAWLADPDGHRIELLELTPQRRAERGFATALEHYDVVIVGAGTAGGIAAIQAARAGVRTLLVERTGCPGGTIVNARINYPGRFSAWGQPIIAGIPWEMVQACRALMGDDSVPGEKGVTVDPGLYAAVVEEAVLAAGGRILYHAMPQAVTRVEDGWDLALTLKGKLATVRAKVLVDCTGDADLARLAGLPTHQPAERQPGTLMFRLAGYEYANLDLPRIQAAYDAAVRAGEQDRADLQWGIDAVLKHYGDNTTHVAVPEGGTSEGRSAAEVGGRRLLLRLVRFLRRQPGLERLRVTEVAPECGVRETFSIVGRTRITAAAYLDGQAGPEALCYAFGPIDIHRVGQSTRLVMPETGRVPTIPRGALLPREADWFIAAGRCIDGERPAHSSFRLQATCMAMGQAAGAMAALAARTGLAPHALAMADIRDCLRRHGAIVPEPSTAEAHQ